MSVLQARKKLRESNAHIYINEHLTQMASDLFAKARKLVKDRKAINAWSWNGKIYVKNNNNTIILLKSSADLANF